MKGNNFCSFQCNNTDMLSVLQIFFQMRLTITKNWVMYFKKLKILPFLTLQAKLMKKKPQIFGKLWNVISGRSRWRPINFTGIIFHILTNHYVQGKHSFETQVNGICTHQKSPKRIYSHYSNELKPIFSSSWWWVSR